MKNDIPLQNIFLRGLLDEIQSPIVG